MRPFKDLTVIELASVLAGPSVGVFFAELGAKVIKVENNKTGGDVTRSWKLASEDKSHPFSAYYSSVNWGKESWFMDLKNKQDRQKLDAAISKADIVIANFKPGDAIKLELDFENLKKLNSKLIYGEITGFGTQNRTAYDVVLQAESGFLSMSGTENGELCKMPVALIDVLAAHHLKEGLLLALLQHQKQAKALKVTVSLYDAALASLVNQGTNWIMGGQIAQPMGTLHPNIAPYGELFSCKDEKKIVLAIGTNQQFVKLCEVLNCENVSVDQKFLTNQLRVKNRVDLAKELSVAIAHFNREELMQLLLEKQVPAGALRNMKEVFELPQAQLLLQEEVKEGEYLKAVKSVVFKISE
ncbi:MAG: crotonobetainyl-CoA:carnitine CoA-transferase CaiB-like acyl-CoA transferase [Vicingaceae bacterium]|jgi:crotonobetainyl-CoA:carnitine CoA-transferase CaiB-like acyl-CoA transferase